jgi:nucleotide-binding universal stress UspA family protein
VRGEAADPDGNGQEFERILVPLDGSARGDWALSLAVTIARINGAELLLAHVVRPPTAWGVGGPTATDQVGTAWMESNREAAEVYLREKERQLSAPDLAIRTRVLVATNVAATLNDLAISEDVNLMVLAAHGESGPGGFPCGCVAHALLEQGAASVLMFQDAQNQASSALARCEIRAVRPRRHSYFAAAG